MQVETHIARQLVFFENSNVGRIITGAHLTSNLLTGKVKQDDHVDPAPWREGTENLFNINFQTGFLANLSGSRFFRTLSRFDEAAGQTPIVDEWLTVPLNQHQTTIYGNQCGSNWLRIVPVNEIARIASYAVSTADRERSQFIGAPWTAFQRDSARNKAVANCDFTRDLADHTLRSNSNLWGFKLN